MNIGDWATAQVKARPPIAMPEAPVENAAAWLGRDLQKRTDWQYRLDGKELKELEAALAHVKREGLAMVEVGKRDFPLGSLSGTLRELRKEIISGRGFVLLRGLPVDEVGMEDAAMLYWGIGMHLGYPVMQNAKGHLLGHVTDLGEISLEDRSGSNRGERFIHTELRGFASTSGTTYHVDQCDIVGLFCLRPAKSGGESRIVSTVSIHNEIMRRRPDLLKALYEPWWIERRKEIPAGKQPFFPMPQFHYHNGRIYACWRRGRLDIEKLTNELPPRSPAQLEALALGDELMNDPDFHLWMDFQKGDVQLLNNYVIAHRRSAYEDFPEMEKRRYLLRLWMVTPDAPPLPHWYYEEFGAGRRGGIYVPGVPEVANLEP